MATPDPALRIAVVCFAVSPGLADYTVGLVLSLRRHAEVMLLTSDTIDPANLALLRGSATQPAEAGRVELCFRRSRHLPVDVWRYVWRVIRHRPDVVLVQAWLKFPLLEIPIVLLFRMLGISCVVTVHDVLPHEPRRWHKPILRLYYRGFDALVAHSRLAREQLRGLGIRRPIAVIPHALLDRFDLDHLTRPAARARLGGLDDDSFVALLFGHISRRKGAFAFAEAARHLAAHPGIRLVLAGRPDMPVADLDRLRADCARHGAAFHEGHVPFEAVQNFFVAADCVVLPYLEGTTSGVLKVALAFGRPVVATPVGDVPETVDATSAVLIPAHADSVAIAAGILEARGRVHDLAAGVRSLRSTLSWEEIGMRYQGFLRAVSAGTTYAAVATRTARTGGGH